MKWELIKKGKVKDIYKVDDKTLAFVFTDRVSAFDVVLPSTIPLKGKVLLKFAVFWFNFLKFPNHMIGYEEPNILYVKKLNMIPLEFIVRGYIYGSLYERLLKKEISLDEETILAKKLKKPFFETTTKYEEKDVPISKEEVLRRNWLKEEEYEYLRKVCIELYEKMYNKAYESGFILADIKFEFGKDEEGNILLADSIGPDEFRLWPIEKYEEGKLQESYDKQPIRDWLIKIGYRNALEESRKKGSPIPNPPILPEWLIEEVKQRYIYAYEKITGLKL
jgi:phosphoribosylaminoimidazole-succinocarboxamide synthase